MATQSHTRCEQVSTPTGLIEKIRVLVVIPILQPAISVMIGKDKTELRTHGKMSAVVRGATALCLSSQNGDKP